jgi:AraC-like DNA-binding protein
VRQIPKCFKLGCWVRAGAVTMQDDQCAEFGVGDMRLFDTSRPFQGGFSPDVPVSELLLLRFPRSFLPLPTRDLRWLTGLRIPGTEGVGALSSQFLRQLARHMNELGPSDVARLSTLTVDVLTTALATALDARSEVPSDTRRRALLARLYAFVQEHLGDANLTPDAIGRAHHISLRYLHKLFQEEGRTVAGWIRERRLEQCHGDLADPRLNGRTISGIAARWGFTSAAHFSQAFRSAYGVSPSEFRRQCTQTTGLCAQP